MLTSRERFLAVLKFEKADYIPNMEWGSMSGEMILRWRAAGMPRDVKFNEFFGLEGMETIRFGLYDPIPGAPDQGMIEQTEEGTSLRATVGEPESIICGRWKLTPV